MMRGGKEQQKNGGFALLVVILVMLITSFLASQLIMQVRTDLQISANIQQRVIGRMLAEGGVNLALFRLIDIPGIDFEEKLGGAVFLHGLAYETVLPTGKMEYYAVSESGKIDLNSNTSIVLLKKFLGYHGLEEEEVDVVVDSLRDWRDNDDLHRINGAEKNYYEELEQPYIPRNGRIEDPAEFFLIRGTESLRGKFDPYAVFTVHNPVGKININELSPDMLTFLVGGDEGLVERYREEQELAAPVSLDTTTLQGIIGNEIYTSLSSYLVKASTVKIYSIVAHGYAGDFSIEAPEGEEEIEGEDADNLPRDRSATKIRVLVDTTKEEFQYLSWREQYG